LPIERLGYPASKKKRFSLEREAIIADLPKGNIVRKEKLQMTEQPSIAQLEPIPQPPGKFILGNLPDVAGDVPILELMKLAREYGPIYQLTFPGNKQFIIVSGYKLVEELCDESRFDKYVT
jgi:hypothetical protein